MSASRAIDWDTAQRIGELIAGSPPYGGPVGRSVQPLAHEFAGRVGEYTGLNLPTELPLLEMIDRPAWIAANLLTMRPLLDPLLERLGGKPEEPSEETPAPGSADGARIGGLLSGPVHSASGSLRSASGHLLGAQLGAVTGMLSQRVLGQYDVSLLDASVPPRLLLLAPNLAAAARNLGVDRDELIAWVAIHEITHAVQFSGAPWLRDHLGGMLRELLDGLQISGASGSSSSGKDSGFDWLRDPGALLDRARSGDLRELLDRARRGEVLRLGLGDERWQIVERMQATMSLIEGHAEHTMDAVGAEFLPSLARLRVAMTRRRASRGLPWRVLERLLGLELKMRQYEVGRRFCDAVVQVGGPEALTVAWRSPAELPSTQELSEPSLWLERVGVPA
jgi:putative hydrolase